MLENGGRLFSITLTRIASKYNLRCWNCLKKKQKNFPPPNIFFIEKEGDGLMGKQFLASDCLKHV